MVPLPEPFVSLVVFVVGLIFGSFLNVCIHRLPRGESVVHPRSRCPSCKALIRWYRNLPVFSWILLRGRCADCDATIPVRYPLVELVSGLTLVGLWWTFSVGAAFPIAAAFSLAMLVLFFTDYDHQLLPDTVTLSGLMVGLTTAWFSPFLDGTGWYRVWMSLGGAALGSGLLWGFGAIYGRLRGVEAMGLGDVKMMAMVGSFLGPFGVMLTIFAGSLIGALVGVLLIPLRGRSLQDTLPFGCFLAPAAVAALLFGRSIVSAYLALLTPPL